MKPIAEFAAQAKEFGKSKFLAAYTSPFLLSVSWTSVISERPESPDASPIQFQTVTSSGPNKALVHTLPSSPKLDLAQATPLVKNDRNPYANRIFIGRSPPADILVRQSSVSKSHAYFCCESDGWTLTDTGSHNKTIMRGVALVPNQPANVSNGVGIFFGDFLVFFLFPERFHSLL